MCLTNFSASEGGKHGFSGRENVTDKIRVVCSIKYFCCILDTTNQRVYLKSKRKVSFTLFPPLPGLLSFSSQIKPPDPISFFHDPSVQHSCSFIPYSWVFLQTSTTKFIFLLAVLFFYD